MSGDFWPGCTHPGPVFYTYKEHLMREFAQDGAFFSRRNNDKNRQLFLISTEN
jgi:hypothetical protein